MGHVATENHLCFTHEVDDLRQKQVFNFGTEIEITLFEIVCRRKLGLGDSFSENGREIAARMFEAVFQSLGHKMNPLTAGFKKRNPHFRKKVQDTAADDCGISHQNRQEKGVHRRRINVREHIAQSRASPTNVNGQRNIFLSYSLIERQ